MTSVDGLPGDWECVTVSLMGQTDFNHGWNEVDEESWRKQLENHERKTGDHPTYAQACMGMMVCPHCGKAVMCSDLPTGGTHVMDLSGVKGTGSSNLPWLNPEDISDKDKLKIDDAREPRTTRKKSQTVLFLDVTVQSTKKKHTWALRKGFTLDALIESLGTESDDWKGKSVSVVRGGNDGQYVNVA